MFLELVHYYRQQRTWVKNVTVKTQSQGPFHSPALPSAPFSSSLPFPSLSCPPIPETPAVVSGEHCELLHILHKMVKNVN